MFGFWKIWGKTQGKRKHKGKIVEEKIQRKIKIRFKNNKLFLYADLNLF